MSAIYAILVSALAGLCTGIGGVISIIGKNNNKAVCLALSFSAGVMLYVSMVELLPEGLSQINSTQANPYLSEVINVLSFVIGLIAMHILDVLMPEGNNPSPINGEIDENESLNINSKITLQQGALISSGNATSTAKIKASQRRLGVMSAIAIAVHNFPEGMITFTTALSNYKLALPIVLAIAIHNIPEGVAIAAPIYYATGSKLKGVLASLLSGLAEPVGALLAYLVLAPILSPLVLGIMLSCVAGIMLHVSIIELLPSAWKLNCPNISTYGTITGMIVMAISLILTS